MARRLPIVQRQIAKARDDTLRSVYDDMAKSIQGHKFAKALPDQGLSKEPVRTFSHLSSFSMLDRANTL